MTDELKPCHLCKCEITIDNGWLVHEAANDCALRDMTLWMDKRTITAWNTRAEVGVKPLVWTKGIVDWATPLPGMKYVACSSGNGWSWWLEGEEKDTRSWWHKEKAAKAAAQSDYETRIRSQLTAAPTPSALEAERDKLRDALKTIAKTNAHYSGQTPNEYHFQKLARAALADTPSEPTEGE